MIHGHARGGENAEDYLATNSPSHRFWRQLGDFLEIGFDRTAFERRQLNPKFQTQLFGKHRVGLGFLAEPANPKLRSLLGFTLLEFHLDKNQGCKAVSVEFGSAHSKNPKAPCRTLMPVS